MKKLVFALAVVAAGAAVAESSIQSSIVGYMTPPEFRAGNTMFGPMFVKVGSQGADSQGSYNVQDLTPTGSAIPNGKSGQPGVDTISLVKLTATGGADGSVLIWRDSGDEEWGGRTKIKYRGWYTPSGTEPVTDFTIEAGQAVWIDVPPAAKVSFTIAGEVAAGDIYMALRKGNTAVANPQPTTINVQNILPFAAKGATVPNGKSGQPGVDTISLVKLTATGGADGSVLIWRDSGDEEWGGRAPQKYYGWYTPSGTEPIVDYTLAAGEGVWVDSPNDTTSLLFPSPLAK